jgi:hypothetical protein
MAILSVTRDSGWADRARAYKVILDGTVIGKIHDGENFTHPIFPGEHALQLKIDWCGSQIIGFNAAAEERCSFVCESNLRGFRMFLGFFYAFFDRNNYIKLARHSKNTAT